MNFEEDRTTTSVNRGGTHDRLMPLKNWSDYILKIVNNVVLQFLIVNNIVNNVVLQFVIVNNIVNNVVLHFAIVNNIVNNVVL